MAKSNFCRMLGQAIRDEDKAPDFYSRLEHACVLSGTSPVICERLHRIARDEERHAQILRELKAKRCQ